VQTDDAHVAEVSQKQAPRPAHSSSWFQSICWFVMDE